ncbi:two-component sensor histidine kinase BarA [Colwellia psychrerythraea]|uniref:histidine kinase n=1 Tax=Colwellia psychrerythraea (strain 34H / ATCC BAA-681) TaxID=167879 RepID=Q47WQ0_COLP3|nr:two-component sensor histidine kinase BarA [Colwellia psychrerythraea]AAZ24849.1 sensor histidine kinase/response regulator [Colwellia psychrerythraea 34H]
MHKISLKDWVIILTIIPTTLIGFGLASYFSYSRSVELNDFLEQRAKSIIEPIAIASKDPLLSKNRDKLRQLIGFTHRNQSSIVKSIVIFTEDNQVFVTSAYHGDTNLMRLKAGVELPHHTNTETLSDYIIFRTPIIDENYNNQSNANITAMASSEYNYATNNSKPVIIGYIAMQIDKSHLNFQQQSQFIVAFAFALLGSLLSAIFAIRLIKKVTKPINSMVQAIERIREGKLESRVSGQLIGELNFLKNGINAMAQSLDGYQNEMQASIDQATIDLRESLEQFEIQNVELSISKRKAQEANRVKSEFLANMSHELRTPLNGVIGFTRQVLKTPLTENQRDYLQTIDRSANNLLTIINDILDFSKLDAGKMVTENIPFSLRESIDETLTLLAPSAHKKNIELSINLPQELPDSLVGDTMRIKQIITNLVSNAIKFTPQGSVAVDITSEEISQNNIKLKVIVTDTGIGMTTNQQRTIFDAFTQADQSITRLYGGTGLGLVICQRLAQEMNGDIGFSSEKNHGSSFWFTFQCEINAMPLMLELDNQHLANKTVLYFEENNHSREATKNLLKHWKMRVTSVINRHELSQVLSHSSQTQRGFDYALIGHNQTATALSELKKTIAQVQPISSNIHLALNNTSPSLQEALIASGAISCMSKPLSPTTLSRVLQPVMETKAEKLTLNAAMDKVLPIKVLAVDDNEANLKLIKALLLEQVAEVVEADNGMSAVELCKVENFSLIFMDIQMPIMDGISALKEIKQLTNNNNTPIIAVTAHALSGEREKMHQQGFNAYMTKPIDETMLRHIIYEYCDFDHLVNSTVPVISTDVINQVESASKVIDWPLALKRSANKADLAKEMLLGLVESLPETQLSIREAIDVQDIAQIKRLVHKLNGACCYTGTPNLAKITIQLETQLKMGLSTEELEPEFLEFFEHIEQVLFAVPEALKEMSENSH